MEKWGKQMWNKTIRFINWITEYFTATFFLFMVILVFFQIISRAILGTSYAWTGELSRYLMIWITFLGASFAFQYGAHISIDIVVKKLSRTISNIVLIITTLIIAAFLAILFFEGLNLMELGQTQKASALQVPMSYVYVIMPISSLLMFLNLLDTSAKKFMSKEEENI